MSVGEVWNVGSINGWPWSNVVWMSGCAVCLCMYRVWECPSNPILMAPQIRAIKMYICEVKKNIKQKVKKMGFNC